MIYEYFSKLGSVKADVEFKKNGDDEVLDHKIAKSLDRKIAFQFLKNARTSDKLLAPDEVEGIIYFLGINLSKLSKLLGVNRSTFSNILRGKKLSKMLCYCLLDAVEKELIFENYFKSKFDKDIECKFSNEYYDLLIVHKAA